MLTEVFPTSSTLPNKSTAYFPRHGGIREVETNSSRYAIANLPVDRWLRFKVFNTYLAIERGFGYPSDSRLFAYSYPIGGDIAKPNPRLKTRARQCAHRARSAPLPHKALFPRVICIDTFPHHSHYLLNLAL